MKSRATPLTKTAVQGQSCAFKNLFSGNSAISTKQGSTALKKMMSATTIKSKQAFSLHQTGEVSTFLAENSKTENILGKRANRGYNPKYDG